MNVLRTTRRPTAHRLSVLGICALLAALVGCGGGSRSEDVARTPERVLLPAPDPERIAYDDRDGSLTFYDLPNAARWVVQLPGSKNGAVVGPVHRLPGGVDPDQTFVYVTRPGWRFSSTVTLRQIQDARDTQVTLRQTRTRDTQVSSR